MQQIEAVGPVIDTGEAVSGQITVTTAGTAVQGPDAPLNNGAYIKSMSTNTGIVYVGNDGSNDVTSGNGFELTNTAGPIIVQVRNMNNLWFDAATNGDKFCWIKA